MEVTQIIVEKNLLPQNKKIELVNPDGKSYLINIGPFTDAHQAAPYKTKIMALLNAPLPPAQEPRATPPPAAVAAAQVNPSAAKHPAPVVMEMTATPASPPSQPVAPPSTARAKGGNKEKNHYAEVRGKVTAQEATELIHEIVRKGLLPKNMHVELVNLNADDYRIRIGPFADASAAEPQMAKINALTKAP
jgi:cell division septation protein DedD